MLHAVGYMNKKNHAAARKPRDAEAILFGSKFAKDKARLQSSKYIGTLYSRSILVDVGPDDVTFQYETEYRVRLCKVSSTNCV